MKTISNFNTRRRSGLLPFLQILLTSAGIIMWCLRIVMLLVVPAPYHKNPGVTFLKKNVSTKIKIKKFYLQSDVYSTFFFKALQHHSRWQLSLKAFFHSHHPECILPLLRDNFPQCWLPLHLLLSLDEYICHTWCTYTHFDMSYLLLQEGSVSEECRKVCSYVFNLYSFGYFYSLLLFKTWS